MIFPHNNRKLSISALPVEYIGSLFGDLERSSFTGHLMLLHEDHTDLIVMQDGEWIAGGRWCEPEGFRRYTLADSAGFAIGNGPLGVEALEADTDAVAMARLYCRCSPQACERKISSTEGFRLASESRSAVLARRVGMICEMAFIEEGRFVVGYRYDRQRGRYRRVGESFWDVNAEGDSFIEIVPAAATVYPCPEKSDLVDPLADVMDYYAAVLEDIVDLFRVSKDGGSDVAADILQNFKTKYPPLYRGVYVNPETGAINWARIVKNRDRVNVRYRYDKFMLYLDELLVQYINGLKDFKGGVGIKSLSRATERRRIQAVDRKADLEVAFFEKVLRALGRLSD